MTEEEFQVGSALPSESEEEEVKEGHIYRMEGSDLHYYIGSTQKSQLHRFGEHVCMARLPPARQQDVTIHFTALGWDKVTITSIRMMMATREDLHRAEGELIKEHFSDPLCLNRRITGRFETHQETTQRLYRERDGVPATCSCGDVVVFDSMERHLKSERHAKNLIIKNQPPSQTESQAYEYEICECQERVRKVNFAYHRKTETHLWNLRLMRAPPQDLTVPLPPPIVAPEGYNADSVWCQCSCMAIICRSSFKLHLQSKKHLRTMMELGLIPIPDVEIIRDDDPEVPSDCERCPCGVVVKSYAVRLHIETLAHKAKMRTIETPLPDQEAIVPEPTKPLKRKPGTESVQCPCGSLVTAHALALHLKSPLHTARTKRREEGVQSPVKGLAHMKEKITCGCSAVISRKSIPTHAKSDRHLAWVAKQQVHAAPSVITEE